jgi:hypothetical protein
VLDNPEKLIKNVMTCKESDDCKNCELYDSAECMDYVFANSSTSDKCEMFVQTYLLGGIHAMKNNTITQEQITQIMNNSKIEVVTMGSKTTVVSVTLPNGFVIVDSSSCVDPENYDEQMGKEIVLKRIENKVWELEGYKLQCELQDII